MRWTALLAVPLFAAFVAGCLGSDDDSSDEGDGEPTGPSYTGTPGTLYMGGNLTIPEGALFAGAALYEDPQNTPHPAWNWPTVSHPATGPNVPYWWQPNNGTSLPVTLAGLEHVAQAPGVPSGAGIALFGRLAVVPGFGSPTSLVDISDPSSPVLLSQFDPQMSTHRGATILAYPTGRLVTVISTDAGLDVWDITDPYNATPLPPVKDFSSHKVGVVPGTPIVYNAGSSGGAENGIAGPEAQTGEGVGITQMVDFFDPENPVRLPDFQNGYSCHHIYFWNNVTEQKFRSTCAGIEYTQIIDTTDPLHPSVLVSVPYGYGDPAMPSQSVFLAAFSHYAGLSRDGKVLMVGDENGGGLGPVGCVARADTPAGSASAPVGAVWFYDVSTETQPRYLGHFSASQVERAMGSGTEPTSVLSSCTAHHGRLLPILDQDVLAMSFYGAGVILIDFSDIRNEVGGLPRFIAQYADGSNTWETWYYNGHLYTGDLNRGMDVLRLT